MNSQDFERKELPDEPGVYLFKKSKAKPVFNKTGRPNILDKKCFREILYIGKATSIKDRIKSYFSNDLIATRGPLLVDMVFQADNIEFIKTDSVLEALILESNLIKKYQPRYNTQEKDDKSYNYVVITKENFPRVLIERGRVLEQKNKHFNILENVEISEIYGPFVNSGQLKEALKIVRRIFPFLDNYSKINNGYGFYREIGLAPEISSAEAKKDYAKNIKNIKLFFEGKKTNILKNLEKEMKILAKNQKFEKADKVKKTIFALNHIQDVALIKEENFSGKRSNLGNSNLPAQAGRFDLEERKVFRVEAYDVAHISGTNTVGVMTVVENGAVNKAEYRKFRINESIQNDVAGLGEILRRRFNHPEWTFPNILVVDGSTAQKNIAEKIVKGLRMEIIVVAVTKDERHRPKMITGREDVVHKYESEILLANSEAHRFAIKYHRESRSRIFKN